MQRPGTPGVEVVLAAEGINDLKILMWKSPLVAGTVTNESGRPMAGAVVRLLTLSSGDRVDLIPVPLGVARTNDRGEYRIFDFPPGSYLVETTARGRDAAARPESRQSAGPRRFVYATAYYPGVTSVDSAMPVELDAGEELRGLDFRFLPVEAGVVSGSLRFETAAPSTDLRVTGELRSLDSPSFALQLQLGAGPRFRIDDVPVGRYQLTVRADLAQGRFVGAPTPDLPVLWGRTDVTVGGGVQDPVYVTCVPGIDVTVGLRATITSPTVSPRVRVRLIPLHMSLVFMGADYNVTLAPNDTSVIRGVPPGWYRVTVDSPQALGGRWSVDSISLGPVVIVAKLIQVQQGVRDVLRVHVVAPVTEFSGTLVDGAQRPTHSYALLVFPADPQLWKDVDRIRVCRPATDGSFIVTGLPSGSYHVAVLRDTVVLRQDALFLEEVREKSTVRFELAIGGRIRQQLRIFESSAERQLGARAIAPADSQAAGRW
jgi:hypothetical protein